jgi:endonuclease/exonuclease/phosphatase family metal-dependent hydrolase
VRASRTPVTGGDRPLVLASWNVHGWVGADARREPTRCFDVIEALGADVVALQEVEGRDWEPLAVAGGFRTIVQQTKATPFGNALLSRQPEARATRVDLSVPGRERRGAIDAVLPAVGRVWRVVATHLGLRGAERRAQALRLATHLGRTDAGLPTALLGDLNDWTPWARQLAPLARRVAPFSRVRTFPSRRPVLALDRVAVRAPGATLRVEAVGHAWARDASDHLPLRATVHLDRSAASMR